MEVHLDYGDGEVDADSEGRDACEQAEQDKDGAKEFGEGRDVGGPGRETEAGDKLSVVVESAENFVVSVDEHDGAQGEAHDEECEKLQAIEVAHVVPPWKRRIKITAVGRRREARYRPAVVQFHPNGGALREIPSASFWAGSRPAGESAGLRDDGGNAA